MKNLFSIPVLVVAASLLSVSAPSYATFHLWTINEVFSNADGSVQFIEMTTAVNAQEFLLGHDIVATDGGQQANTFNFNTNLGGPTANRTFLIATQKFADITGLEPDYIIPPNFLFTQGGSINFGEGSSVMNYSKEQLPKNGVQSINGARVPQIASPKNFAGFSATIETHARPSINPNTLIMNAPVLNAPGIGIGNVNFAINLENLTFTVINDYYVYGPGITGGNDPVQFQNGTALYIPAVVYGGEVFEFSIELIADNPFLVFGNPTIHNVTPASAGEQGSPQDPGTENPPPEEDPVGEYPTNPGSGY